MSEMNNEFEQLLEETSLVTIHNGEVVEGTVISVKEDEIVLNIGYKADGIITRNEYSNQSGIDLRDVVKEGDKMNAKVLKVNDGEGQVLLTYKRLAMEKSNERIREAFENKEVLTAKVVNVLTGGLSVIVDETKIFIPAMQDRRLSSLSASLIQRREESLVIESSFWLQRRRRNRKSFLQEFMLAIL